jgi:hypothetical protein
MAHPGHELRLHGWMERTKPLVCVLTNGAGHGERSRLDSTTRLLHAAGARPGSLYGRLSDRAVYQALLTGEYQGLLACATELAACLVAERTHLVVGDACEGYNPTHDICRAIINAAVVIAARALARPIANHVFATIGDPAAPPRDADGPPITVQLDDAELRRKLAAARAYVELADEVNAALAGSGEAAFRTEYLWCVGALHVQPWASPPHYENHGAARVAEGYYQRVVRYRDNVQPFERQLTLLSSGGE